MTGGVLLLSSALLFYLPCYGVKKLRKRRKDAKAMRQLIEERRRFEAKILDIRNMGKVLYLFDENCILQELFLDT